MFRFGFHCYGTEQINLHFVLTVANTSTLLACGEQQRHLINVGTRLYSTLRPFELTNLITRINTMFF